MLDNSRRRRDIEVGLSMCHSCARTRLSEGEGEEGRR